ncbi:MAG: DEAD/DEAH box helicase family protein [Rhodocyclaceae bacterium]|nr:DEAD/DEAH box helicase family protein [Rhodocyclaceae bacterium]
MNATRHADDRRTFRNEDLLLAVRPHNPATWDETRYEAFLDALCGHREYQKAAIRTVLSYWLGGRYTDLRQLAKENFETNEELRHRWSRWDSMQPHLQLPEQLACSLDLATGTGKSFVLYGIAAIMLAEGAVDRVLVLCPSNTIEAGLLDKFKQLATDATLRDLMPAEARIATPRVINASETIVDGALCVENYHAILEHVNSSIRDSLKGKGARVAVLNDEAHHVANESGTVAGKWKSFLLAPEYGFRYVLGVSGTCYVADEYFSDVVFRYSLRQAIEERFVKKVEYVAEMPATHGQEDRWQLIWQRHNDWKTKLRNRNIRPLTIVVTQKIPACKQVAEYLVAWLVAWEQIKPEEARAKVLVVTSAKEHQVNVATLRMVDSPLSKVEWIISVSMLSEGWDVKNVFQIVPHEERAFNSKLLIAQVLGRGLRRPEGWTGDDPVVTVFNHDSWSGRIKHLVDEILEIERRLSSRPLTDSSYHFDLHNLDYTRKEEVSDHPQSGEYQIFGKGYVILPSQVVDQAVTVEFEEALTGKHSKFNATIRQKTFSLKDVAEQLYQRLKSIDQESADAEDPEDHTHYTKHFPRQKCTAIVTESLRQAGITDGRITDDNRQKFLQALGPLRRKGSKRVVYVLAAEALVTINTGTRQAESCSAAELRRGSKSVFYTEDCMATLADEQQEFFTEVVDPDGDFAGGRVEIANPADFKTPMNLAIADATPERKFMRELTSRKNSKHLDAWLKNAAMNFYSLEYAWKKGEHPKRGEFNPDFFIKQGEQVFVAEIKDEGEITDPSPENVKKHEYARDHFARLNAWLEKEGLPVRYQFNMLAPRDFDAFFQKLREDTLTGFRSVLDAAMINAGAKAAG